MSHLQINLIFWILPSNHNVCKLRSPLYIEFLWLKLVRIISFPYNNASTENVSKVRFRCSFLYIIVWLIDWFIYLFITAAKRGGTNFIRVCLCVCLFVCL